MSAKLSVVIVNYKTRAYLPACLDALLASTLIPEIILVDNDGSAAELETDYPVMCRLAPLENSWFCGGNNLGMDAATGNYVLLLNPDTVVQPDALAALVTFMATHPGYQGATMQMRYPDGSIQRTCSRRPPYIYLLLNHSPLGWLLPGWRARLNREHWYTDWDRTTERDVEVLPGSCLLLRRSALRLDHDLLLYFPEDDLAQRLAGKKFRYLCSTYITHHEKAATQSWLATRVYYRDMLLYTRKHHGLWRVALLWLFSRPLLLGMWLKRQFLR